MQRFERSRQRRLMRSLGLALLLVLATVAQRYLKPESGQTGVAEGRPRLVDGDSFFLGTSEVRMQGIDAPEGRQTCRKEGREWRCGEEARRELSRQIGSGPVRCDATSKDQHGRLLATCTSATGRNLNAGMVAAGYAVAFGGYEREEGEARAARRGLWASEFERPRDWRRRNGVGQ